MAVNASAFVDLILARAKENGDSVIVEMQSLINALHGFLRDVLRTNNAYIKDIQSVPKRATDYFNRLAKPAQEEASKLLDASAVLRKRIADLPGELDSKKGAAEQDVMSAVDAFFGKYFPTDGVIESAISTANQLISGGLVAPSVESAIWQRDRARVLEDAARSRADLLATFAARGFPMPPGAAAHAMRLSEMDAQVKIAQHSRDVAIKRFDTTVENMRFGLERMVSVHRDAVSTLGDFLRNYLAIRENEQALQLEIVSKGLEVQKFAQEHVRLNLETHQTLLSEVVRMFGKELDGTVAITGLNRDAEKLTADSYQQEIRALGDMASAMYNAVHASAGVSAVGETD